MKPVHFYHVWVGDRYHGSAWQQAADEHFHLLEAAQFDGDVRIGLVGGLSERASAMRWLREAWPASEIIVTADEGYEMITLEELHGFCQTADPDTPVYYAHTKGAMNLSPYTIAWRKSMDIRCTWEWSERVADLQTVDAAGCHWLTHADWPGKIDPRRPMFGGNFWWANAGYLAKLPPLEYKSRYHAEGWMGQGFPEVRDLVPGWPIY